MNPGRFPARDRVMGAVGRGGGRVGSGSLWDGTTRRDGVDRLAATLILAGWDRTSAIRRKVPLTSFASARPRQRTPGDRSCSGGVPARGGRGHLLGRSRAVSGSVVGSGGGHLGPQEPGELPGDGRGDDALGGLAGGQPVEAARQALLRRPRPGDDRRGRGRVGGRPTPPRPRGGAGRTRPTQASWARRWALPALVSRPRWTRLPLESSLGTSPQNPMNAFALAKRRQSATSAANVSAPSPVTPR
jgi:hypothetical protein